MAIIEIEDGRRFQVNDEMLPPEAERNQDGGCFFILRELLKDGWLPDGVEIEGGNENDNL